MGRWRVIARYGWSTSRDALHATNTRKRRSGWFTCVIVSAFIYLGYLVAVTVLFVSSIIVEIAQMNSPTRTPQVGDVVGSALGLAAALGAVCVLSALRSSDRSRAAHVGNVG